MTPANTSCPVYQQQHGHHRSSSVSQRYSLNRHIGSASCATPTVKLGTTVVERYNSKRLMTTKLSHEAILAAIEGFESQRKKIDTQIAELRQVLNGGRPEAVITPGLPMRKRRKFSASARRRMKEAQQRRWAAVRGEMEPSAASTEAPRRKRRLSAAGRQAIIAATKRRWALKRAEGTKKQPAASKKAPVRKARAA